MRLKSFIGESLPHVMEKIRKELGPDALIISTLKEANQVRITAAVETPSLPKVVPSFQGGDVIEAILQVIEKNKVPSSLTEKFFDKLQSLDASILEKGVPHALSLLFSLTPVPLSPPSTKPILLVGPPGAGKSVAIGKLAAQLLLQRKEVAIINLDTQKSGAIHQLKVYAEALKAPYAVVKNLEEIPPLLATAFKGKQVLIDTTGLNPFCEQELRYLAGIILTLKVAPLLVLPAALDVYEALDMVKAMKGMGTTQFIHTKIDLSFRLTALLGVLMQEDLTLVYVGKGPALGDPLMRAEPGILYQLLFSSFPRDTINYSYTHKAFYSHQGGRS